MARRGAAPPGGTPLRTRTLCAYTKWMSLFFSLFVSIFLSIFTCRSIICRIVFRFGSATIGNQAHVKRTSLVPWYNFYREISLLDCDRWSTISITIEGYFLLVPWFSRVKSISFFFLKKKMLHCTFLTAQAARSIVNLSMLAHCICKGVFAPIRGALLNFWPLLSRFRVRRLKENTR